MFTNPIWVVVTIMQVGHAKHMTSMQTKILATCHAHMAGAPNPGRDKANRGWVGAGWIGFQRGEKGFPTVSFCAHASPLTAFSL